MIHSTRERRGSWACTIALPYSEDGGFWDRDAGLLCKGIQLLGVPCKLMAFGEPFEDRQKPLVLGTRAQMEDAHWWKQQGLEGVILYAWAVRQFEPISRAISSAGLKLILVLDNDGLVSPHVAPWRYFFQKYCQENELHKFKLYAGLLAGLKTFAASRRAHHSGRLRHLSHAMAFALPSPLAKEKFRRFLIAMGREELAQRTRFVPYAVTSDMVYDPKVRKESAVVVVGRWGTVQKNTPLMVEVLERMLSARPDYRAYIVGTGLEFVRKRFRKMNCESDERIRLVGFVPHEKLPFLYQKCQILLSASHHESFHLGAGEALCCGCSVVGDLRISSMPYLAGCGSGTVYGDGSPASVTDALLTEIAAWEAKDRDPIRISKIWTARLHPARVANEILSLADDAQVL